MIGEIARKSIITAVNDEAFVIDTSNSFARSGCNGCVAYITESSIVIVYMIISNSFLLFVNTIP